MYGVFKSANDDDLYIEPAKLFSKVERVFLKLGVQKDQAVLIADHLVMANVKGHDSHGISLIPLYVDTALRKAIRPCAEPKLVHDGGVILNVDGHKGFGQVAAYRAMEWAIARAQTQRLRFGGVAQQPPYRSGGSLRGTVCESRLSLSAFCQCGSISARRRPLCRQ